MLVLLFGDPFVRISLSALALQAIFLFVLPVGQRATVALWSDSILLALNLAAMERAARTGHNARERRFWRLLAGAGVLWLAASVLDLVPTPASREETHYLVTDAIYLAITFVFIVALGMRPDRGPQRDLVSRAVAVEHFGTAVFAFALLGYFVIVPYEVNKPTYATLVPSMSAFVILDWFLVLRTAWLALRAGRSRWRTVYSFLGLVFLAALAHDTYQLVEYARGLPDDAGTAWDLVWTMQFVAVAGAAAGARLVPNQAAVALRPRGAASPHPTPVTTLVPFAFALPLLHLVGRVAGLLDPVSENGRDLVVLATTPVLGALAMMHQGLLGRRHEQVRKDLQATQEELQQSRKMEALGQLAGGVAHDFNNVLAVILGYSDMLLERARNDERLTGPVEEIRQAAERALTVTRQLTVFSQRRPLDTPPVELDAAVAAIAPLLERLAGAGVTLERRTGAEGRWIGANLHQFERALINLVANAREAMPDGGWVAIETGVRTWADDDPARPRSLPAGSYLRLAVIDTGSGLTPETRSRACDPFFTTKEKHEHPGLGLSVVYGIVRQAGGILEIESEPGLETTVTLFFPEVAAPRTGEAAPAGGVPRVGQATVLVAEDDEGFRALIRTALEREGYRVLEAADGRAALDVAARYEGRIDLLVSDLVMPGVDGRRLAERLTPGRPEMRVLFVSGHAGTALSGLELPEGNAAFLQKPFSVAELVRRVAEVSGVRPTAV